MVFPFIVKYGVFEPYRSNNMNRKAAIDELTNFTSQSKDTNSIFKQLEALGIFSQEVVINDTLFLLLAGFDTISHLITSCLFQLKKNPDVLENLKDSLHKSGISGVDASKTSNLKDLYEDCDYMNYVIKETLRIDGPAMQCIMYYIKEDLTLCRVPFKKRNNDLS